MNERPEVSESIFQAILGAIAAQEPDVAERLEAAFLAGDYTIERLPGILRVTIAGDELLDIAVTPPADRETVGGNLVRFQIAALRRHDPDTAAPMTAEEIRAAVEVVYLAAGQVLALYGGEIIGATTEAELHTPLPAEAIIRDPRN